ncbi:MAG: glycosyltransferase [Brevinematales bacterium]|nr:glycosyltransferase [Brevinematales bacterium]
MQNKVCVLTVTYGNRYHLVEKVITRSFEEGVNHCVIVDNASSPESASKLRELARNHSHVTLLSFSENLGSAGGYKAGLEKIAMDIDCEYILLLDDDNVPEKGCLEKLFSATRYLKDFPYPYALLCYRKLFEPQTNFISYGCDFSYKYNAFASTNVIKNLFFKLKKLFPRKEEPSFHPLSRIDMAPYGGFFFPKTILSLIGYPKEEFFVYVDDLEYTFRLTQKGGFIFICSEAKIEDIDISYEHTSPTFWLFQEKQSPLKIYYYIRNATYCYHAIFRTNNLVYLLNMVLWWFRVVLGGFTNLKLFFQRFPLIIRAVLDGLKGKLGKTF